MQHSIVTLFKKGKIMLQNVKFADKTKSINEFLKNHFKKVVRQL